ncbi:PQQ-binding-like beta-propeller repeat protein [Actinoplanes sp. NPDC051494]|uniref:outer membrane protein assembly factor BamB family protein n=1 Tax=Actinoplanes sp. NPDC051494 TaxID=3363907 RepID=UPI0037B5BAA6
MAVIELGLVTGDEPRAQPWRPRPRLLAAAVAILCLLTVTGSAPVRSHSFTELWSVPFQGDADAFTITGDAVYVLSGAELTAYEPHTGATRWTVPGLDGVPWIGPVVADTVLLPAGAVDDSSDFGGSGSGEAETVAIDAATGRQRWRLRGGIIDLGPGRVLLGGGRDAAGSLRVVDLRDGSTLWSRTGLGAQTRVAAGTGTADRVVTATAGGRVTVQDAADGRLVATAGALWPAGGPDTAFDVAVTDHTLHVQRTDYNATTLTVYDTETLTERWRTTRVINAYYDCGPVMCLVDQLGLAGVDGTTGDRIWFRPGDGFGRPLSTDRILVDRPAGGIGLDDLLSALVDSRTGRQLGYLDALELIREPGRPGPAYLIKRRTRQPPGRSAIAELNERTGEVLMRGSIERPLDYSCESAFDVLACVTADARLVVTDLRGGG